MAWETRKGGGNYYTRSWREGGRVVRSYIGSGEVARCIAQIDELDKEKQAADRERTRLQRAESEALDTLARDAFEQVEAVLRATLAAAGYHRHARGQWRKRRGGNQ